MSFRNRIHRAVNLLAYPSGSSKANDLVFLRSRKTNNERHCLLPIDQWLSSGVLAQTAMGGRFRCHFEIVFTIQNKSMPKLLMGALDPDSPFVVESERVC